MGKILVEKAQNRLLHWIDNVGFEGGDNHRLREWEIGIGIERAPGFSQSGLFGR